MAAPSPTTHNVHVLAIARVKYNLGAFARMKAMAAIFCSRPSSVVS